MVTKICVGDYVADIYHRTKFYPNRFRGYVSAHAWFRAPRHKVTRLLFLGGGSWERSPPRCAHRFSAQGSAFWGSRNQHTISKWKIPLFPPLQCSAETLIRLPFSPKNRHFEAIFRRDEIYSPENGFNIRRLESKTTLNRRRSPIIIV